MKENINKDFLIWLVGFFEGEGSCGCYLSEKNKHGKGFTQYKLQATISQKEREILDHIKEVLQCGSVAINKGSYGLMYHWRVDSLQARLFLNMIFPFLKTNHKKKQVFLALSKDHNLVNLKERLRDNEGKFR